MRSSKGPNREQNSGVWSNCSNPVGHNGLPLGRGKGAVRQSKDYSFIQNRVPSPLNNNFLLSAEQQSRRGHGRESSEDYMSLPVPYYRKDLKEEFKLATQDDDIRQIESALNSHNEEEANNQEPVDNFY